MVAPIQDSAYPRQHVQIPDGMDGLRVECGSRLGVDELEEALVELEHEVLALAPDAGLVAAVAAAQLHDAPGSVAVQALIKEGRIVHL